MDVGCGGEAEGFVERSEEAAAVLRLCFGASFRLAFALFLKNSDAVGLDSVPDWDKMPSQQNEKPKMQRKSLTSVREFLSLIDLGRDYPRVAAEPR